MNQEKFDLTWHTYTDHLREMLHYMMNTNELTDVTLVSDDKKQFKAHKIVLSASSPLFKSIISDSSSNPYIFLRGIQSHEVESILQFIYLGQATFYHDRIKPYQDALGASGHGNNLNFDDNVKAQQLQPQPQTKRRNRSRKITWFNPPFSLNVKTNIGKVFLQILKECFPKTHILHKICNRNTIKISYRTMPNMNSLISKHNNLVLQPNLQTLQQNLQPLQQNLQPLQQNLQPLQQNLQLSNKELEKRGAPYCNCQDKANCPMPGKCKNSNLVYRYRVTQTNSGKVETYTGCTVGFKVRHDTHMRQMVDDSNGSTTLSSHVKSLRESNTPHTIIWSAKERAPPFNPSTGWCRLCTLERYYILFEPTEASLNQRAEFFCHCFHKRPQLLINRK